MGTPIAYLRKSRVFSDRPGVVSHAQQEDAVRALALRHGYDLRSEQIVEDWGRSGGEGREHRRPAYLALRAAIEKGAVTDVFAFDQSRLTRSNREWAELAEACRDHGVSVHLVNGGTRDFASADGRMTAGILAQIATAERERAVERAQDAIARRRASGERLGPPAYGVPVTRRDGTTIGTEDDPAAVVAAFVASGSYNGAAKLLNAAGVKPKRAAYWRSAAVKRVIAREAPDRMPVSPRQGAKSRQHWFLAGLLRCHCGGILTASKRMDRPWPNYKCQRAWTDVSHPRPTSIAESRILPWVKDEAARLVVADSAMRVGTAPTRADFEALDVERMRIARGFQMGLFTEEEAAEQLADVNKRRERLEEQSRLVAIPSAVNFDAPAGAVNGVLRALWRYVELGPDFQPVRAEWVRPGWRRED